jgi:uncharacterized protein with HEPN domain
VKDDRFYLILIQECIAIVEEYTSEGREAFLANRMMRDAVVRNLHILAESTQRVSNELKARYTEINWRDIAGFRNVLVHGYIDVDMNRIWDIVANDLPTLKSQIETISQELEDTS